MGVHVPGACEGRGPPQPAPRPPASLSGLQLPAKAFVHLSAAFACLFGLHAHVARGEDDWDVPKKDAAQPADEAMTVGDFSQWALNGMTLEQVEANLRSQFAVQLQSVTRECGLSAAQQEKVRVAGEGDIRRMTHALEQFRQDFCENGKGQQNARQIVSKMNPLKRKLQSGIFDDSSLFRKVIRQTLKGEQAVRYEKQEGLRRKFRYEAKIELALASVDGGGLTLTADQRQRLLKLIADETQPPKKPGPYDQVVVFIQAAKLNDAKFKAILDDGQLRSLKQVFQQYEDIAKDLRERGFIE